MTTPQSLLIEPGDSSLVRDFGKYQFVLHPKAPVFAEDENPVLIIQQLAKEIQSPNFQATEGVRDLLKQVSYVNLWFFLKFVAGFAGPFDLLNTDLHLDMCNFRQRLLEKGIRGAMALPRSHYKSTIVTEGGSIWEILRWPNIRIRITGATADKAVGFMHTIKNTFDANEFMKWLFPEYVPSRNQERWNDAEIVIPNRSRYYREPTVLASGSGSATEGHHFNLHIADDLLGMAQLNAMKQGLGDMYKTKAWFWSSEKTLLVSLKNDRVIAVMTRYAVDDLGGDILERTREVYGAEIDGFVPKNDGKWIFYYRKAIENGKVIFPENFSLEIFDDMASGGPEDFWTWITQYMNEPKGAGLTELSEYAIKRFRMVYDEGRGWLILKPGGEVDEVIQLKDVFVTEGTDPAATEKFVSAKTSRSATVVIAQDWERNWYILQVRADYVPITTVFRWVFDDARKFKGNIKVSGLEAQSGFKVLVPLLRSAIAEEMKVCQQKDIPYYHINLRPVTAVGDKDARIRSHLVLAMSNGKLWCEESYYRKFLEESEAFPQSLKKDILDATSIAMMCSSKPTHPELLAERAAKRQDRNRHVNSRTGY
ncbi:MAG: hypothetical protein ABID54_14285 [Pseudomonadota bacterium]